MASQHEPPAFYESQAVSQSHIRVSQGSMNQGSKHASQEPVYRSSLPTKDHDEDHFIDRRSLSIPLDPMYIKVLQKIFPQLSPEIITRELQLCYNDLTKTVEIMLKRYQSALKTASPNNAAPVEQCQQHYRKAPLDPSEHHYRKASYQPAPTSPKVFSRESSPASPGSGYSPGPPSLYTPVVYPSDTKYDYQASVVRSSHSDVEHRVYAYESDYRHEMSRVYEYRRLAEDRRSNVLHAEHLQLQNGAQSYDQARDIAMRHNKENSSDNHYNVRPVKVKEETDPGNQELNVTSSVQKPEKQMKRDD